MTADETNAMDRIDWGSLTPQQWRQALADWQQVLDAFDALDVALTRTGHRDLANKLLNATWPVSFQLVALTGALGVHRSFDALLRLTQPE